MTERAVIATTTFASNSNHIEEVRAQCVLKTIESAKRNNYKLIAVDGGSPLEYINEMKSLGAQIFTQDCPGMGNSRRQVLHLARDAAESGQAIIWTEPEKYTLIPLLEEAIDCFSFGN